MSSYIQSKQYLLVFTRVVNSLLALALDTLALGPCHDLSVAAVDNQLLLQRHTVLLDLLNKFLALEVSSSPMTLRAYFASRRRSIQRFHDRLYFDDGAGSF